MALSRVTRFITLLLAAVQFAAPAVASVADGAVGGRAQGSHIEEVGQNRCTPPHSADCAICRFISNNVGETTGAAAQVGAMALVGHVPLFAALGNLPTRQGFDSRAPPTLLV